MSGPGEITLLLSQSKADEVSLELKDSGKGIPPEVLSELGQRGSTFGKPGGHGLGLANAHELLKSWGGKLSVESLLGQGTTVRLQFLAGPQNNHRNGTRYSRGSKT